MSLINRIEVSNFLNLDEVSPYEPNWCAHYPHLILNCGGQNTIIQLTNGGGKSTITNAILALLSRHSSCINRVREILAPKRQEIYTHIRIEVLFRDKFDHVQEGFLGEISGEPYVIGLYGYYDKSHEISFYIYQGELEDCPVATTSIGNEEIVVDYIKNSAFEHNLKKNTRHYRPRNRQEYLNEIYQHFDEKMINQLIQYQKLGGGDGNSNFFKINKRSDEPFSATFFFEHLAPEVLIDCMGDAGEEDEHAFEDTLIQSSRRVIDIELRQKKADKEVDALNYTYGWLDEICADIHEYEEKQDQLTHSLSDLWSELKLIQQCVETEPLSCIPTPISGDPEGGTLRVANNLVLLDGEWLIPDALLLTFFDGLTVGELNRFASKGGIANCKLKRAQVIDIYNHNPNSIRGDGPENKGYTRSDACLLIDAVTQHYLREGSDRNEIKRAINDGHKARLKAPTPNPFRIQQARLRHEVLEHKRGRTEIDSSLQSLNETRKTLNSQIQHFNANESAYIRMVESTLFTESQLSSPMDTEIVLERDYSGAGAKLDALNLKNVELEQGRRAYRRITEVFGAVKSPLEKYKHLKSNKEEAELDHKSIKAELETASVAIENTQKSLSEKQTEKDGFLKDQDDILNLKKDYDLLIDVYSPTQIPYLAEQLESELANSKNKCGDLISNMSKLAEKIERLRPLNAAYEQFLKIFDENSSIGLRLRLENRETKLVQLIESGTAEILHLTKECDRLEVLQLAHERVTSIYGYLGIPINRLELHIKTLFTQSQTKMESLNDQIAHNTKLTEALSFFERQYDIDIGTALKNHRIELAGAEEESRRQQREIKSLEQKLCVLNASEVAPLSLSNQVLDFLQFDGATVHTVIQGLELTATEKEHLFIAFSQLLHAPVVNSAEEARALVARLYDADLDYPVFERNTLEKYCYSPPATANIMVGCETLQVKAIIDPTYIPMLIEQLTKSMNALIAENGKIKEKIEFLRLDGEHYQTLLLAETAIDERAVEALERLKTELENESRVNLEMDYLLQKPEFQDLSQAIRYIDFGGSDRHAELKLNKSNLSAQLNDYKNECNEIENLLTPHNKNILDQAEQFENSGGCLFMNACIDELSGLQEEQAEADVRYEIALNAVETYSLAAKRAKEFLKNGGEDKLSQLNLKLNHIDKSITELISILNRERSSFDSNNSKMSSSIERVQSTSTQFAKWGDMLKIAQTYIDSNGVEFDSDLNSRVNFLKATREKIHEQLKFSFKEAQEHVNAKEGEVDRDKLVSQLSQCVSGIETLEKNKLIHEREIDAINETLMGMEARIQEFDNLTRALIQKYKASLPVLSELTRIDRPVESEKNTYVEGAIQFAREFTENIASGAFDEGLESFRELIDIMGYFKFEEKHKDALRLSRSLAGDLQKIENAVVKQLNSDTGLRSGERAELSNKSGSWLFSVVRNFRKTYEAHCLDAERKRDALRKDVDQQQSNLSDSLLALSSNIKDNFDLMYQVLKKGTGRAGFTVEAEVLKRDGIKERIDALINAIKSEEISRRQSMQDMQKSGLSIGSEKSYLLKLKQFVRENFYRAVFKGPGDLPLPKVYFEHPCLAAGRKKELDEKLSTGQQAALSLLLLAKLAQFASERDRNTGLISLSRRKGGRSKSPSNKVVMIDGLFSNLSDKKLIQFSLETVKIIQDQFQLIGWVHNPDYKNEHSIFPRFYNVQRVSSAGQYMEAIDNSMSQKTQMVASGLFVKEVTLSD